MSELAELLGNMHSHPQCLMDSPTGIPAVQQGHHILPEDIQLFYRLCGGLTLVEGEYYLARIVSPHEVIQSNSMFFYGFTPEELDRTKDEPSWSWYIIGHGDSGMYISIDFGPSRLGFCYYSFWDSHAEEGKSPIIATSFFDLLNRMWASRGMSFYEGKPEFKSLGDFYDLL